jgi:hypothetical protein
MRTVVSRYSPVDAERWNSFVHASKNGTFLFQRAYMDYHADRFADHSLLFTDSREQLVAILPAVELDASLVSHAGLTYGGVVSGLSMTTPQMLYVFESLRAYLGQHGYRALRYKAVPHIYHRHPAEEDRYALFRSHARMYRVDVLSVIQASARLPLQERRRRRISAAQQHGLHIRRSDDLGAFWRVLEDNLAAAHGAKPTHSLDEISLLCARFPENIHLHLCMDADQVTAGILVYDTPTVAHAQYIATTARGREAGALDLLISHLVDDEYSHRPFFDLGISNEDEGRVLNIGLVEQKEGFGARAVAHEVYEMAVS